MPVTDTTHDDDQSESSSSSSLTSTPPPPTIKTTPTSTTTNSSPSVVGRYMWKIAKFSGKAPCARFGHATCLFVNQKGNESMLMFGGWEGMNMLNDLYVFDLVTQEWSMPHVTGKIPSPRAGHSCTLIYSKNSSNNSNSSKSSLTEGTPQVLLMGGGNGLNYLSDIHILDLESWEWSQPVVRSQVKVYIKDDLILNQNLYGDSITDSNSPSSMQSMSNEQASASSSNNEDYRISGGGHSNNNTSNGNASGDSESELVLRGSQTAEIMDTGFGTPSKNAKINNRTIVTMKEVYPAPRSRHSIVVTKQGRIIMFGGGGSRDKIFDDLWVLNPTKMEWSQPKTLNKPGKRWGHGAVIVENRMYIFGGVYESRMLNELYEMDTDTYQWRQIILPKSGPIPAPRAAHTCTLVHDKYMFILFGGDDNRFLDDLFIVDLDYVVAKRLTFKSPKARCAHTSLLVRDKTMYVFGGGDKSTRFKELYMLDVDIAIEKSGIVEAVAHLPKPVNLSALNEILTPTSPEDSGKLNELKQEEILAAAVVSTSNKSSQPTEIKSSVEKVVVEAPVPTTKVMTDNLVMPHINYNPNSNMPPPPPPLPPKMTPVKRVISQLGPTNQFISVRTEIRVDDSSYQDPNKNQQITRRRKRSMSRKNGLYGQDQQVYSAKDAKEVTNWLVSLGLGRYAAIFTHEEIDMDCVAVLTEADLFRIGVNRYGPRKKILAAAREFSSSLEDEFIDDKNEIHPISANSYSRHELMPTYAPKQSGDSATQSNDHQIPPPPPPPSSNMSNYHAMKQHDRQLNQLTQAVSNLSMAIEGINEAMKTMTSTVSMLMAHMSAQQTIPMPQQMMQQSNLQQQHQQQQYLNYMRHPAPPTSYQSSPSSHLQPTSQAVNGSVPIYAYSSSIATNQSLSSEIPMSAAPIPSKVSPYGPQDPITQRVNSPVLNEGATLASGRKRRNRKRKNSIKDQTGTEKFVEANPYDQLKPSWYEMTEMDENDTDDSTYTL